MEPERVAILLGQRLTGEDRVIGFEPVFDLVKGAALRVDDKRGLTSSATSI